MLWMHCAASMFIWKKPRSVTVIMHRPPAGAPKLGELMADAQPVYMNVMLPGTEQPTPRAWVSEGTWCGCCRPLNSAVMDSATLRPTSMLGVAGQGGEEEGQE